MKTTRYLFLMLLMTLVGMSAEAQQRNVLQVPDVTAQIGNVQLPVSIENTDEIVGVQFDLTLPEGVTAEPVGTLSNRSDGHSVNVSKLANGAYRVLLHSNPTTPLLGQSGVVMYLPINVPDYFEEDSEHAMSISNAVLGKATGENVLTEAIAGKIRISKLPDLTVKDIAVGTDPASAPINPGGRISVSWQVENIGAVATGGGWSEQVSLVSEDGKVSKLIATTYYEETLQAGGIVSRQVEVTLPTLLGIGGKASLQVKVIPTKDTGESTSAQGNNTATTDALYNINKVLVLTLSPNKVTEGSTTRVTARLERSGRWDKAETFTITATEDSRISVPQTVTIPAKQSGYVFYVTLNDNDVLDDNSIITLSASGNGYEAVQQQLEIEDNEYPSLTLTASKSLITEGETFQLTVTTSRPSAEPIVVTLTSENAKRFSFPQTVTIPAGETSATVDVTATDDDVPSLDLSNAFTASAPNHNKDEIIVLLNDNDLPEIEMELTPSEVSEGAGPQSVMGVLRRKSNINKRVTIMLSDDAPSGSLFYTTPSIEMAAGVEEVQFTMGPVDNATVDGVRTYNIIASTYVSDCSCTVSSGEGTIGSVKCSLTVLDDDGPTLTMTPSATVVREGQSLTITIGRNTVDTSEAVNVSLTSTYDANLSYDHNVTIPAGSASVEVTVTSLHNDTSDDNISVTFTATAENFTKAVCWFMVTDQTKPDLTVSDISLSDTTVIAGGVTEVRVTLNNIGFATMIAPVAVNIYTELSSAPVVTLYYGDDIPVGSECQLSGNIAVGTLAASTQVYAIANEEQTHAELLTTNNTSRCIGLNIVSPFKSTTVQTDKAIYDLGEKVAISGQMASASAGLSMAGRSVEVYVINNGYRVELSATTDANGRFTVTYTPEEGLSGHFAVGACYPGENKRDEMTGFDIYGLLRVNSSYIKVETAVGDTYRLSIPLRNPCSLPLTGVEATLTTCPDGCDVKFSIPTTIEAEKRVELVAEITGSIPSPELKWYDIGIHVSTVEGASLDIPVYYYCASQKASLAIVGDQSPTLTLPDGYVTEYQLTITNRGRGESGVVSIAMPEGLQWLQLGTATTMGSMAQNDSTTIVFLMTTEGLNLNVDSYATVGINCENGDGTYVRFNVTPVATSTASLHVVVADEFTYNTEEAPFVVGATVTLRHPSTNAIVASGTTGTDGVFDTEVAAGYYNLTVSAEKHDTYNSSIYVMAGRTNTEDIFLPYQAIQVDWTLERISVEDEYKVVITADYEVNVPAPVVVWTYPDNIPTDDHIFYVSCINKGKMPAYDLNVEIPQNDKRLTFTPLMPTHYDILNPESSLVFPVQVTVAGDAHNGGTGGDSGDGTGGEGDGTGGDGNGDGTGGDGNGGGTGGDGDGGGGDGTGDSDNPGDDSGDTGCYTVTRYIRTTDSERICDKSTGEWITITKSHVRSYNEQVGNCPPSGSSSPGGYSSSIGGLGGPGGGGSSWYSGGGGGGSVTTPVRNCNPCVPNILHRLAECGGQWIPYYECAKDAYAEYVDNGDGTKTLWCIVKETVPGLNCFAGGAECAYNSYTQDGYLNQDQRDECLDALLGTCGEDVADLVKKAPVVSWIWKAKKCWDYFTAPCGSKIDGDDWYKARRSEPSDSEEQSTSSVTPSFMKAFYENTYRIIDATEATHNMFVDRYGDESWTETPVGQLRKLRYAEFKLNHNATLEQMHDALDALRPDNITRNLFNLYVERLRNTWQMENGYNVDGDNHIHPELWDEMFKIIAESHEFAMKNGYDNVGEQFETECNVLKAKVNETSEAVCATITLKIDQKVTMTREAFRGTLTVTNGNETTAMRDVKLLLRVRDAEGNTGTAHEFAITPENITGFEGDKSLTAGWTLEANGKGVVTILFIPTKYAAPTEPVDWSFGGELSYIDPYSGLEVTRELSDVTLAVNPSPVLDLTYFLQRDVYADDPLTDDIEPSREAEFALLINNKGYGDATDVRIVTSQPEIISNDRKVKLNFDIVASQLNGQDKVLALKGEEVKNSIGRIPAGTTAYAQWRLVSDMLGHFVNYNVEATHVTNYGNPELTLLDEVTIHELIHSVELSTDDTMPLRGFLVNDIADADDLPDMLYLTNGEVLPVSQPASVTSIRQSASQALITVTPTAVGWVYANLLDPSYGLSDIKSIVRQSDGKDIPVQNFWQTDRTLRDGLEPLYENRLHLADDFEGGTPQTYVVTFNPTPEVLLAVKDITPIPEEGKVVFEPITPINVTFTKSIDPETFTVDDLAVGIQGEAQDVSTIGISTKDNQTFSLDMSQFSADTPNGYYLLTVQTADITDSEGFNGKTGKTTGWIFFRDGFVKLVKTAMPANAGTVSVTLIEEQASSRAYAPATEDDSQAHYGSNVTFTATPAEGYELSNWTLNGKVVSTEPTYTAQATGDMNVVANFRPKTYLVEIASTDETKGTLSGTATGIYEHGTEIEVKAVPAEDCVLKNWTVDGEAVENSTDKLSLTVEGPLNITADFIREYYRQTMTLARGWNWMSAYLREPLDIADVSEYVSRIVGQTDELIKDPEYGLVGNISELEAGKAYKIQASTRFTNTFRGHLYDVGTAPITLYRGWNWMAYPNNEQKALNTVITNAEEGDYIASQTGFSEYADGNWEGTLDVLTPGSGYLYKSATDKTLTFDFSPAAYGSRVWRSKAVTVSEQDVDIHRYPNTMNMTVQIVKDGMAATAADYNIYAMVDGEMRGIGQSVGTTHYLTVYGDEPVEVTFVVEQIESGTTYVATETLKFIDDVVGSRKSPFVLNIGSTTGIEALPDGDSHSTVYTLQGILVSREATQKQLRRLPKGVYIVNGQMCYIK